VRRAVRAGDRTINYGAGGFPTLRHGETEAMTDRLHASPRDGCKGARPRW
jgi:hypothetical protein